MAHTIDGKEVIANGSVVLSYGQKLSLEPFDDDKEYRITFDLTFYDPAEEEKYGVQSLRLDPNPDKNGSVLTTKRPFKNDFAIAMSDYVDFASDASYNYFAIFAIRIYGRRTNYTTIIDYTITKKGKA